MDYDRLRLLLAAIALLLSSVNADQSRQNGNGAGGGTSAAAGTGAAGMVVKGVLPEFTGPITNITAIQGKEALLSCNIKYLGNHKVGWMRAEDQTIMALQTHVVTHSSRVSADHDGTGAWTLRIKQLREADSGCYMCQVNTTPMKKQIGCIDVQFPPDILDDLSSGDVTAQEGDNATLVCKAAGNPQPKITWKREGGGPILLKKTSREITKVDSFVGENLSIIKLDRRQMGAYFCIASNDIPPARSKRITLNINFAPVIKVPNQLLGAPLGTDVLLECNVEAFPNTVNYWVKNRDDMLLTGKKHLIKDEKLGTYKFHLQMIITNFSKEDLGTYMCISTNSLGRADGNIRLYEIKLPLRSGRGDHGSTYAMNNKDSDGVNHDMPANSYENKSSANEAVVYDGVVPSLRHCLVLRLCYAILTPLIHYLLNYTTHFTR